MLEESDGLRAIVPHENLDRTSEVLINGPGLNGYAKLGQAGPAREPDVSSGGSRKNDV